MRERPGYEELCDQARMEPMIAALRAEKIDRKYGISLPGDSALYVVLAGFEEYLATTKQRRARREARDG